MAVSWPGGIFSFSSVFLCKEITFFSNLENVYIYPVCTDKLTLLCKRKDNSFQGWLKIQLLKIEKINSGIKLENPWVLFSLCPLPSFSIIHFRH